MGRVCDLLAKLARHLGGTGGNRVGLQRVSARLVEDHPAKAVFNGNGHLPCGTELCAKTGNGNSCRLLAHRFGIYFAIKHLHTHSSAGSVEAAFGHAARFADGRAVDAGADLAILDIIAVAVGNEDVTVHVGKAGFHLNDAGIGILGGKIAALQHLQLVTLGRF